MPKIAFVIQARLASTRLPNKIILPFFNGKSIIELLIEKLKKFNLPIILATSTDESNLPLVNIAKKEDVYIFRGSENDVLQRFIMAAEHYGAEKIIRVCSDNPFLDIESMNCLIQKLSESDFDYVSFQVNGIPSIKTHFGFWAEGVTLNCLQKVASKTSDKLYHEHVTNYIYTFPNSFSLEWLSVPICLNERDNIRLTIDTANDFASVRELYGNICAQSDVPTIESIVSYLDAHPTYLEKMKQEINTNTK